MATSKEKKITAKIINPEKVYDIDEESKNINNFNKDEEGKLFTLRESQIIPQNSEIPKESPNESQKIQNYEENLFSINSVYCKLHNKQSLKLNPDNFEIVCQKCIEEGKNYQLEISTSRATLSSVENDQNDITCYVHEKSKGSFYCEDCQEFICKMCFAEEHRMHKCHLPEVIRTKFQKIIQDSIESCNKLTPVLIDTINAIKKIYDDLNNQKNEIMKVPQNMLKIISNNNDDQINSFYEKSKEKFLGIDNEIFDNYTTFNVIKTKGKKYLETLGKIIEELNGNFTLNRRSFFELCKYHKQISSTLNEINNYINSSTNFINIRLNNTNEKYEINKNNIEKSLSFVYKELNNYENNCTSSILTGRQNKSIILRRFIHFSHTEIIYFKNTVLAFASNNDVFLTGLCLCGLYIRKNKTNTPKGETDDGSTNYNNKSIDLQITISTIINKTEGDILFTQTAKLNYLNNSREPSIAISFNKAIKIIKEKLYLIKVENISSNNYVDIWMGSVGKMKKKDIQVIRCHNTGIQFLFKSAEGIQTDFGESEKGIIEGILYTNNK
jgi:hypothetical protein